MDDSANNPLVEASNKPKLKELISQFQGCTPYTSNGWNRLTFNERQRLNIWANQWADGKKRSTAEVPAFPFEGANDHRPMLADELINEAVDICVTGFARALGRQMAGAKEESQYALKLLGHLVNDRLVNQLQNEVELSAQYMNTLGWTMLHPTWNVEIEYQRRTITLEELLVVIAKLPKDSIARELPMLIMDETMDEVSEGAVQELYQLFAKGMVEGVTEIEVPPMKVGKARKVVKQLREEGKATVALPVVTQNGPMIYALKPWEEVFIPGDCTNVQKAGVIYHREWLSEAELRAKIRTEDYHPRWVEEALKFKGKFSSWGNSYAYSEMPTSLASAMQGTGPGTTWTQTETGKDGLVEVIHAVYRALDEDDIPAVYHTIFHVSVADTYALHEIMETPGGVVPYVAGQRELWTRLITGSRGIPEIVNTWQRVEKVTVDGVVDYTSVSVFPPLHVYQNAVGARYKFGPGVQNTVQPGKEPGFLNIPSQGLPWAFQLLAANEKKSDRYFGRRGPNVDPVVADTKQQGRMNRFLMMWSEALKMALEYCRMYMPDAEFADITGAPVGWLQKRRGMANLFQSRLSFDVRELDPAFVQEQLRTVNETVIPSDVGGAVDRAKWTKMQLQATNPLWAAELIQDGKQASQQLFQQVQQDIALMALGNEPQFVEMDPAAGAKLQYAQQIIAANPKYQEALRSDPRFMELIQKYAENLMFSQTQEQNKQVGRIGVQPEVGQG